MSVFEEVVGCVDSTKMILLTLLAIVAVTAAHPSYIAVPADQIAFVDLRALHTRRVPRQTLTPPPLQPILYNQFQNYPQVISQPAQQLIVAASPDTAGSASHEGPPRHAQIRAPDFGEYVDFGAHTGNNGAFGWYADYPLNHNDDSSSYRK